MVRPNAGHPQRCEMETGWLVALLAGGDREEAARRVETLAGLLWFDGVAGIEGILVEMLMAGVK